MTTKPNVKAPQDRAERPLTIHYPDVYTDIYTGRLTAYSPAQQKERKEAQLLKDKHNSQLP